MKHNHLSFLSYQLSETALCWSPAGMIIGNNDYTRVQEGWDD